jgi:hypothetical protein
MKMADQDNASDDLRPEYEEGFWKDAVRGKYAKEYAASAKVVRIAPDLATSFPSDESVNEALRLLLKVIEDTSLLAKSGAGSAKDSQNEDVGQFFSSTV